MKISDKGLEFIKDWEDFSPVPYDDAAGHPTIGYGHKMRQDELGALENVSEGEALKILRSDVETAESDVGRLISVPLNQNQFDALVSFMYNLGGGDNVASSKLVKLLNKGYYGIVPDELNKWVHAGGKRLGGLVRRRKAEGRIFSEGIYAEN